MNFLNIFEDRVSGIFGASQMPFSFKKLAKQSVREMEDQTLVINGANTAPALFTILVANADDQLMAPYYQQLTRELGEFVKAHAEKKGYGFVGEPLVRFIIDPSLKPGKFSVFAENIDHPTLARLYEEERAFYRGVEPEPMGASRGARRSSGTDLGRIANAGVSGLSMSERVPSLDAPAPHDPFAPSDASAAGQAIPVPKTVTREQLAAMSGAAAGLGGAAAVAGAGAAMGAAAAVGEAAPLGTHMAPRRAAAPGRPLGQIVDVVTGDTYELTASRMTVGRERANADIVLRDPNVSRSHAELTFNGSDWTIEDLNSTNGTLVNNRRISRCPLRSGDMLTFGLSTFEFKG